MKRRVRIALVCLAAVAALACAGFGVHEFREYHRLNFGVVAPGVLYRSGQPDREDMVERVSLYKVRTIINLREPDKVLTEPPGQEEIAYCAENGIDLQLFGDRPRPKQVEDFFKLLDDPARRPLLVHCAAGKERSGIMIACYRIAKERWTYDQALAEMVKYGFRPADKPEMTDFVAQFAKQARGAAQTVTPSKAN